MLQDTGLFDKFPEWLTFGDLVPTYEWSESPSEDERYTINAAWRFRDEVVGHIQAFIYPTVKNGLVGDPDTYTIMWAQFMLREGWQRKSIYTTLLKTLMDELPKYGVTEFAASPLNRTAEGIFRLSGFEWQPKGLTLDLEGKRLQQWRKYADGGYHPAWRRDTLDEFGSVDDVEHA